ncbi:MAG: hypothetical protein V4671_06160, partial [Armatimonadota bacterium]
AASIALMIVAAGLGAGCGPSEEQQKAAWLGKSDPTVAGTGTPMPVTLQPFQESQAVKIPLGPQFEPLRKIRAVLKRNGVITLAEAETILQAKGEPFQARFSPALPANAQFVRWKTADGTLAIYSRFVNGKTGDFHWASSGQTI